MAQHEETSPQSEIRSPGCCSLWIQRVPKICRVAFASLGWLAAIVASFYAWYYWTGNQDYYETTGGTYETFHSGNPNGSDKIAIISIRGTTIAGQG